MQLTSDQQVALDGIMKFLIMKYDPMDQTSYLCTLTGSAGTGKTTLTKEIISYSRRIGLQILAVAPTHKARRVLHNIINTSILIKIPTTTVAGLLGAVRTHSYIGTQHYTKDQGHKMGLYDVVLIDEVSMVSSDDFETICKLATGYEKKSYSLVMKHKFLIQHNSLCNILSTTAM